MYLDKAQMQEIKDLAQDPKKNRDALYQKLEWLVTSKSYKYRAYPNHDDLMQDGREAIIAALNSYNPETKGDIIWWVNMYVKTKIARKANQHSLVRVPIKHAKIKKPEQTKAIQDTQSWRPSPEDQLINQEILNNVSTLPGIQRKIIELQATGHTSAEILKITKISAKDFKSQRESALQSLQA